MGLDDLKKVYPDNYRLLINGLQCNVPSKIRDEKQRVGGEINALKQHAVQAPPKRGTFQVKRQTDQNLKSASQGISLFRQ